MSGESQDEQTGSENVIYTRNTRISPNLVQPERIASTYVGKIMVAIDHEMQIATLTLLASHPVPKISNEWGLESYMWEVVGELKIPVPALNAVAIYHLAVISGGVNVEKLLKEAIQKEQRRLPTNGMSYGPTGLTRNEQK